MGRWVIELSFLPLRGGYVLRVAIGGDELRSETSQDTLCVGTGGGVSIVRIVSLFSCRHEPKPGINKRVPETAEPACALYLDMYCITVVIDIIINMIMDVVYNIKSWRILLNVTKILQNFWLAFCILDYEHTYMFDPRHPPGQLL